MIYLTDILKLEEKRLFLLNNNFNKNNRVSAITVMEDINVQKWIHGGEILLTNSNTIPKDNNKFSKLIKKLSSLKVACLIIKPLDVKFKLASAIVSIADECNFPIFSINKNLSYLQIMNSVNNLLYEDSNTSHLIELDLSHIIKSNEIKDSDFDFISSVVNSDLYKESVQIIQLHIEHVENMTNRIKILNYLSEKIDSSIKQEHNDQIITNFLIEESNGLIVIIFLNKKNILSNNPEFVDFHNLIKNLKTITLPVLIGISNIHSTDEIKSAKKESEFSIKMANIFNKRNEPIYFKNVALWQIIKQVNEQNDFYPFIPQLNDVLDNINLSKTLFTFFEQNESISSTSRKLFSHPNTIRYRLNEVKHLTGLDYKKTSEKLILYIALISKLLEKDI